MRTLDAEAVSIETRCTFSRSGPVKRVPFVQPLASPNSCCCELMCHRTAIEGSAIAQLVGQHFAPGQDEGAHRVPWAQPEDHDFAVLSPPPTTRDAPYKTPDLGTSFFLADSRARRIPLAHGQGYVCRVPRAEAYDSAPAQINGLTVLGSQIRKLTLMIRDNSHTHPSAGI